MFELGMLGSAFLGPRDAVKGIAKVISFALSTMVFAGSNGSNKEAKS
jgi:hypothetical protein